MTLMTNERSKSDLSENLFPDKPREVIGKLGVGFNKLNDKLASLLEENQRLKQQYENLQEEHRETLRINLEVKEEHQETLRINLELKEKYQEILRINEELKEKLQEKDEYFKNFQQHVLNLGKQSNEETQQLEIIFQKLKKTLEILELDEINENVIKILKEKNNSLIDMDSDSESLDEGLEESIRVVVGLDFGIKYSGFSYCHVANEQDIITHGCWPGEVALRTHTVLQYDDEYNYVKSWGTLALAKRPNRRNRNQNNNEENKPVELFMLHLSDIPDNLKPKLPVDYKKAITDYLREIGKLIKETVVMHWPQLDFLENVLIVLSVPAEYSERAKAIMRECVYNARLIEDIRSSKLQFITEPIAAALYCMKNNLKEHVLEPGTTLMVVNCGDNTDGTVDLTTLKLIDDKRLGEIVRSSDFCGSTFIDKEFIKFLRGKLGTRAIDRLMENYDQFQYMVQGFCRRVKIPFTGDDSGFVYEIDLESFSSVLLQYASEENREIMENNDWSIELDYETTKSMFDPIVNRIIRLIHTQLSNNRETCSAMILAGEFGQNRYLQKKIKQEFQDQVGIISVPSQPTAAISRGAVIYGLP